MPRPPFATRAERGPRLLTSDATPPAVSERAIANLRFIRETMEMAGAFTAISGWGQVAVGIVAIIAAWVAGMQPSAERWVAIWVAAAVLSVAVSALFIRLKARRTEVPLNAGPLRKMLLSFSPPMLVGAVLTIVLLQHGLSVLLPGVWLLLYGAAVVTAGTFSVRAVPVMGLTFMLFGVIGILYPWIGATTLMIGGFGVLHLVFGSVIAWRYGG
jgi:hypothetical protein